MRLIRHDVRDMKLAFGLAFDATRIVRAGFALAWTAAVLFATISALAWQINAEQPYRGGLYDAWVILFEAPLSAPKVLLWAMMVLVWWMGYAYLNAPVSRSAALDLARDEREEHSGIPALSRQATFAPLIGLVIPLLMFLVVLLWSLFSLIPGDAGAVITAATVPLALIAGLIGGAVLLMVLLSTPLIGPTAVIEGRDYFEAISRPISYVMQRPGTCFCYGLAKLGMLLASALVGGAVLAVAWGMVAGALWLIGQGGLVADARAMVVNSHEADLLNASHAFGLGLMFWVSVGLLACWLSVVGLSCNVIIYMLLRYKIDGVTFDRIAVAEEFLRRLPNAQETAEQAEKARERFDEKENAEAADKPASGDEPEKKPEDAA